MSGKFLHQNALGFEATAGAGSSERGAPRDRHLSLVRTKSREVSAANPAVPDDGVLVSRAQAGDTRAFESLMRRHQRRAFVAAQALLHNEQDALDVVQEAFLRAFRTLDRFGGGSSFFTWLYRIVTNLALDFVRKPAFRDDNASNKAQQEEALLALSATETSDPSFLARRNELVQRLQSALEDLPPYHRHAIVLRELEGLEYDEIVQLTGVSKGTVMSRLFYARKKLQAALADYAEDFGIVVP